jgi:hypothetical protein
MAGPRVIAHLDDSTIVVSAMDGDGQPWPYVGGLQRLPAEQWGCACQTCATTAEQVPYEAGGVFYALAFTTSHARNSAASVRPPAHGSGGIP